MQEKKNQPPFPCCCTALPVELTFIGYKLEKLFLYKRQNFQNNEGDYSHPLGYCVHIGGCLGHGGGAFQSILNF